MARHRIALALVAVALFIAWPVLAATSSLYLPLMTSGLPTFTPLPTVTPAATPIPMPLPPSLNACQPDPNARRAPNYPVKILAIDKAHEIVTLQNVSSSTIDLTNWTLCSITDNQIHPIFGSLGSGDISAWFGPKSPIWNDTQRDDGALYDPNGSLVSYLVCIKVQCP